jgi:hypothetical protein
MSDEDTVLSLNPDTKTLLSLEAALRGIGFNVVSVSTPIQARFELEMGRCAVFLASYVMSSVICRDLIGFFRNSCPGGLVVFRAENEDDSVPEADVVVLARDNPQAVALRVASMRTKSS